MCVYIQNFSQTKEISTNEQTNNLVLFTSRDAGDNSREAPSVASSSRGSAAPTSHRRRAGECEYRSGFLYLFIYLDGWMHGQAARLGLVLVGWLVTLGNITMALRVSPSSLLLHQVKVIDPRSYEV